MSISKLTGLIIKFVVACGIAYALIVTLLVLLSPSFWRK